MDQKKTAYLGLFAAIAIIFGYVESLIPFFAGIPGMKLGLANLAVLFVLALLLDGLVVLPKFLLERKSFGCAFEESLRVLCSRAGQLFALALRWMLTAAVRTGLMLLCGALLFYCVILGVGFASTAALLQDARRPLNSSC